MAASAVNQERKSGSDGLRIVGALAAILLAAGLLTIGVTSTKRSTSGNTDVAVEPGKVSVVGSAKVRQWNGQTFAIDVPLQWAKIYSGPADGAQVHAWALPSSAAGSGAKGINSPRWSNARRVAAARMILRIAEPKFSTTRAGSVARTAARSVPSADPAVRFGDLGVVTLPASDGRAARSVWRLGLSAAGDSESRYYFTTCDRGRPRETWQVVFDRTSVRDQQAALQSLLGSLKTTFPVAANDNKGCSSTS